jgi:hypothetical protein
VLSQKYFQFVLSDLFVTHEHISFQI